MYHTIGCWLSFIGIGLCCIGVTLLLVNANRQTNKIKLNIENSLSFLDCPKENEEANGYRRRWYQMSEKASIHFDLALKLRDENETPIVWGREMEIYKKYAQAASVYRKKYYSLKNK